MADAPNTNTAGKILASVGDGSNTSQWRNPVTVWTNADYVSGTDITIGSSGYTNIGQVTVSGGFNNYLVEFSFGQGSGTPPASRTDIDVGLQFTGTGWQYERRAGWMGPTGYASYAGTFVWVPNDYGPFTAVLGAKGTVSVPVTFGCITVIGIS